MSIHDSGLKTNYINPFMQPFINSTINPLKYPEVNPKDRANRTYRKKAPESIIYTRFQDLHGACYI